MSLNQNQSSHKLGDQDGAPSSAKFSIYTLDSNFLPSLFAVEDDGKQKAVSRQQFQNFFNKLGDASSVESQVIPSMIKDTRDVDQDSFTMEHQNEFKEPSNGTQVTQIYVTSEEDNDSMEAKSFDQLIQDSDKRPILEPIKNNKNKEIKNQNVSQNKSRNRNRVDVAGLSKESEEDLRSAKGVRRLRKKVSVTSRVGGKSPTNRMALALSIVEGNLTRVEEIVDAYIALYRTDGLKLVTSFRYDIHPRTWVISESLPPDKVDTSREFNDEESMYMGLSPLHVACAFDQEHVLNYFFKYRLSTSPNLISAYSGQTLLHTAAWFGTLAPTNLLLEQGCDPSKSNLKMQTPLHLAALQGHRSCISALLKKGSDPMAGDLDDNTPLHNAVLGSHYDSVRELLNNDDVDVNYANHEGGTSLHYASSAGTVGLLLANGADPTLRQLKPPMSCFEVFLERMPEGCNLILNSYLKSNGKSAGAADFEITMNYALFLSAHRYDPDSGEIVPLVSIVEADQREILKHPVCESYLHFKWLLIKKFFYSYITFYAIFLACLTVLILFDLSPIFEDIQVFFASKILFGISIGGVGILFLKNMFLLSYNAKLYFRTMQNAFEMSTLIFAIIYFVVRKNTFLESENNEVIQSTGSHSGALTVFTSWVNFTLLLGKLPAGGIYINMIVGTSKDVLRFLLLYSTSIVAFALCFHILSSEHEHFSDPLTAIMCTLAMMVGEFNFGDLFVKSEVSNNGTTQIMFVLFLVLVSIIIMNLLIGLAISNITAQFQSAGVNRLRMTVLLVHMMDDVFATVRRCAPCFYKNTQILDFLMTSSTGAYSTSSEDIQVFIYPNKHKDYVCVREHTTGMIKKTSLRLPPWILVNIHKILQAEQESLWQRLEVEVTKKRQEERLLRLVSDMRSMRREVVGIKHDISRLIQATQKQKKAQNQIPQIHSA